MSAPPLRADQEVARILAESDSEEEIYRLLLAAIGDSLGWELGAIWELDADGDELRCLDVWCAADSWNGAAQFAETTRNALLVSGQGLPGIVLKSGEATWVVDFGDRDDFPRARRATAAGVRSAACFPIQSARQMLGAIEFFSSERREADAELLGTMATLGSQIGQLLERRRAEAQARQAGERQRAIVEAALDCIVTVDERGRVLEFNPAAVQTFGYRADQAIGREMAELIVPPHLRERHREGFARCIATGGGPLLGTRVEITGMRPTAASSPSSSRSRGSAYPVRRASRASCATSPTATGRRRTCAPPGGGSWRLPTPRGGASSATCTTARSSGL